MTEVKALLKEARKLVDTKNFKEAQECCKSILKQDKQNYLALVLLGKSLQDSDQAPLAFQKAISCKADNPLAWFGLLNYYEKQNLPESKRKSLKLYGELLKLQIDDDKVIEILFKLQQLAIELKSNESIHILLDFIKNFNRDNKVKNTAQKTLIHLLKTGILCMDEDEPFCLSMLTDMYEREPTTELELVIAQVTLQNQNIVSGIENTMKLDYFSKNENVKAMVCLKICDYFVTFNNLSGLDIGNKIHDLTLGIENSKPAKLINCLMYFESGLFLEAYNLSISLINFNQPSIVEIKIILKCTTKLENWILVEKLSRNFIDKISEIEYKKAINEFLFLSLVKQFKWNEAINVAKRYPIDALSLEYKVLYTECLIELNKDATSTLEELKTSDHYVRLVCLQHLKNKRYNDVVNILKCSKDLDQALCQLYLGIAYWELQQYNSCILHFLKAAKLDSSNADAFLYLGHYYGKVVNDLEKSRKCYEKAHNLRTNDSCIIKALSEVYSKLGQVDKDFDLLQKYTENGPSPEPWSRFRLGLHYTNKRDWESAITNFRIVIKQDKQNATALECLADAYLGRGSYTSALRAYNVVIALNLSRKSYCQMRMGYIYSLLTQYAEAITAFEEVLIMEPDSMLALKGVAETWIRIAEKKKDAKLFGAARDFVQKAVDHLTRALMQHTKYLCLWKLFGDALMLITKLPDKYSYIYLKETFTKSSEYSKRNKMEIFQQAITCYSHISKSKMERSSHDLALAYYAYYKHSHNVTHCHISINLIMACLRQNPDNWQNWNLLGKLLYSVNRYNVSQHSFIKALSVAKKWEVAKLWCNLGILYIKLKLNKHANYCFWRGQSSLPSYPHSWTGQGLIAEVIREEEAMDLFRHASRLGYHKESALGYADWVCRSLKHKANEFNYEIESLHAIPYAMDLMEWFLCYEPDNACALTILGILQERQGILQAALKYFVKAHDVTDVDKKNLTMLNIARVYLRLENYDEAIKCYKSITEASFDSACGLALALYKNRLYEESYSTYDTALQWLSSEDNEKADLLVAMAGIVYQFKGLDDAKTLLFHSIQVSQKRPTATSLFGICSLGLMHSDQGLSKLAISELRKYEKDVDFSFHIAFLKSYILLCDDLANEAHQVLSESLHEYPNNSAMWYIMSQYCLNNGNKSGKQASICAQKALCNANTNEREWNSSKGLATASIAEYVAGNKKHALKLAKVGLHLYPGNIDMRVAIILTLIGNTMISKTKSLVTRFINYVKRTLPAEPLLQWLNSVEKEISVL